MPFKQINVNEQIVEKRNNDAEFDSLWQESRNEYKLLAELVKIRKEANLSQTELAEKSGNKQQVISRIEKMKKNNIEPKRIQFIYPKINSESNLVLVDGRKNGKVGLKVLAPLYVHNEDGSYTDEVLKLFGKC